MAQFDAIIDPLFAASHPDVLGRNTSDATLPIAFLDDVYGAQTRDEIFAVYTAWTKLIVGSNHCSIALLDSEDMLVRQSLSGPETSSKCVKRSVKGSAVGEVYLRRESLFIPRLGDIPHPAAQSSRDAGFVIAYLAPIMSGLQCFGTLTTAFKAPPEQPSLTLTLVEAMARCMGAQLMLLDQMNALEDLARVDPLTGTRNRRAFDEAAPLSWSRWKSENVPFALLTLDIDRFKRVNDDYGHSIGDEILKQLADRIMANTRENDTVFRLGGEEFGVLLPATTAGLSLKVAQRIHTSIRRHPFVIGNLILPITASFGVTGVDHRDKSTMDVINRADGALYSAKHAGRDQIIQADSKQIAA